MDQRFSCTGSGGILADRKVDRLAKGVEVGLALADEAKPAGPQGREDSLLPDGQLELVGAEGALGKGVRPLRRDRDDLEDRGAAVVSAALAIAATLEVALVDGSFAPFLGE